MGSGRLTIQECEQIAERNLVEAAALENSQDEAGQVQAKLRADISMAATYLAMYKRDAAQRPSAYAQQRRGY